MKRAFFKIKLKRDFNRIKAIHWSHFIIVVIAMVLEIFKKMHGFNVIFEILGLALFYNLYYITVKKLYYTFWTFTFFTFMYQFNGLVSSIFAMSPDLIFLYGLALSLLLVEIYLLSSPIFFPRVNWWEYDFRYREDLKIKVKSKHEEIDGRMTDLRRGAGCLVLFSDYQIGDSVQVRTMAPYQELHLTAQIMSKREYSAGRGISYGVRFRFIVKSERRAFKALIKLWKDERKIKSLVKYSRKEGVV